MPKLIVANWKANPDSLGRAVRLAKEVARAMPRKANAEVVLCPPFVFLEPVARILHSQSSILNPRLGAQDAFWEDVGPYTGEVSWHQLKHLRVKYVIIGHSDRRRLLGETDDMVNKKVLAALKAGLKVILCVGDTERGLRMKDRGLRKAQNYIRDQLKKDLKGIKKLSVKSYTSLVICYEPVWAISTARSKVSRDNADTPEAAGTMIMFMKHLLHSQFSILNPRVMYGGSVNPKNARGFLSRTEIDGALVGAASLHAKDFAKVIKAAE